MCICINCRHIHKCKLYKFIEEQHNSKKFDSNLIVYTNINFIPINTLIQVNINYKIDYAIIDWDLIECSSFIEKPGSWFH